MINRRSCGAYVRLSGGGEATVLKVDITPGLEYAFRERRATGVPFQRVRILEHIRGNKWRVEWIDPNPGLVHYVESSQLIVAWKEHKAFLRRSEEHTSELQSPCNLVCRLLLEKKKYLGRQRLRRSGGRRFAA